MKIYSASTIYKAKIIIFLDKDAYLKFSKMRLLNKYSFVFIKEEARNLKKFSIDKSKHVEANISTNFILKKRVQCIKTSDLSSKIIKDYTFNKFKDLNATALTVLKF